MAGDWIPMRIELFTDPAVIQIAADTGLDEYAVIGRLYRLWSWANAHLSDGFARLIPVSWVDQYLSTPGFAAAMIHAGWLTDRGSKGFAFSRFDRWNSASAKSRLGTARRVRDHRERHRCNGPPVTSGVTRPLPEKRRGELKDTPPTPRRSGGGRGGGGDRIPPKHETGALVAALADCTGMDAQIPRNGRQLAAAAAELAAVDPPFTPEEVRYYGRRHPRDCPHTSAKTRDRPLLSEVMKFIGGARRALAKERQERDAKDAARKARETEAAARRDGPPVSLVEAMRELERKAGRVPVM